MGTAVTHGTIEPDGWRDGSGVVAAGKAGGSGEAVEGTADTDGAGGDFEDAGVDVAGTLPHPASATIVIAIRTRWIKRGGGSCMA